MSWTGPPSPSIVEACTWLIADGANGRPVTEGDPQARQKLEGALAKQFRVHFFRYDSDHRVISQDISSLDPDASTPGERGWGGLTEFATSLSDAVATLPEPSTP